VLSGRAERSGDLRELTLELTAEMLYSGGLAESLPVARETAEEALRSGAALQRFGELIERQGGDPRVIEEPDRLPRAAASTPISAREGGWVVRLDARLVGDAAMALGAGRSRRSDPLDPAAGVILHAKRGDAVERDAPWATLYHGPGADVERSIAKLEAAISIGPEQPAEVQLLKERRP
jgi:thymidine phosphorylase